MLSTPKNIRPHVPPQNDFKSKNYQENSYGLQIDKLQELQKSIKVKQDSFKIKKIGTQNDKPKDFMFLNPELPMNRKLSSNPYSNKQDSQIAFSSKIRQQQQQQKQNWNDIHEHSYKASSIPSQQYNR